MSVKKTGKAKQEGLTFSILGNADLVFLPNYNIYKFEELPEEPKKPENYQWLSPEKKEEIDKQIKEYKIKEEEINKKNIEKLQQDVAKKTITPNIF
jgi:hypothetical protein